MELATRDIFVFSRKYNSLIEMHLYASVVVEKFLATCRPPMGVLVFIIVALHWGGKVGCYSGAGSCKLDVKKRFIVVTLSC